MLFERLPGCGSTGSALLVAATIALVGGCGGVTMNAEGLACPCGDGYVCHPTLQICAPEVEIGCDATAATCPSDVATGDACPSTSSFIPCEDGAVGCEAGCRTCQEDGTWSECIGKPCTPTGTETCNGVDDDCDGQTDEEGAGGCDSFYRDDDRDGHGVAGDTKCLCAGKNPYDASTGDDCNDGDGNLFPGQQWYADCDGDGSFSGSAVTSCTEPLTDCIDSQAPDGGWSNTAGVDCDDEDITADPAQQWHADCDGDGYFKSAGVVSCLPPITDCADGLSPDGGWTPNAVSNPDCDDTFATCTTTCVDADTNGTIDCREVCTGEKRRLITIHASQVAADLTDYPVLVSIADDTDLANLAATSGSDIYFTGVDGVTLLSYEIEQYRSGPGTLEAWVKLGSVSSTTDTSFYLYYGGGGGDQQNATAVWTNGYVAVYHMNQNLGGGSPKERDSTSNNNAGDALGGTSGPTRVSAYIGDGVDLQRAGTADYIDAASSDSLNVTDEVTVEAWASPRDCDGDDFAFVSKSAGAPGSAGTGTTTFEQRIGHDDDDSEESLVDNTINWNSSDLELGEDADPQIVGMRWRNVTIPQGATITLAYVDFRIDSSDSSNTDLTFNGEAADDAAVFQDVDEDISSRATTSASVAWNNVPNWSQSGERVQSPDLASIIQEIVDRGGWSAGNSLVVMVTGSGTRTATSHNGSSSGAPVLHVEYATTNAVPSRYALWFKQGGNCSNGDVTFCVDDVSDGSAGCLSIADSTQIGWSHYAGTYGTGTVRVFVDGSPLGTRSYAATLDQAGGQPMLIGRGSPVSGEYFDGTLDEVRISRVARSPEWLQTQHANHSSPATFYTIGSPECAP